MKLLKKILASTIAIGMICSISSISVYADGASSTLNTTLPTNKIVDNDALSGQGGMSQYGFQYITGSSHFNNDARRSTSVAYPSYTWYMPYRYYKNTSPKLITITLDVYLNDVTFTANAAKYMADDTLGSGGTSITYYNQNRAPAGWSRAGGVALNGPYINGVTVSRGNSTSGTNVGADAIRFTLK